MKVADTNASTSVKAPPPETRRPSKPIEDYALLSDTHSAALVARDGSIDWLCLPRFDSDAVFAALLGDERHGRYRIAPVSQARRIERRYRPGTLVLETDFTTDEGAVRVIDFMPIREQTPRIVRIVEGLAGRVSVRVELIARFGFGAVIPWRRKIPGGFWTGAGPDALVLRGPVALEQEDGRIAARFHVAKGESAAFVLAWQPSFEPLAKPLSATRALAQTERWWRAWSRACSHDGPDRDAVVASLVALKGLTYTPTGGIVAAATTSLPEQLGGVRNWDYRYCWLRDATFTLYSLLHGGYEREAFAWRDWLLRAVAGDAAQLQVMYGTRGERRLDERELPWLPGYEGSRPVRIGNAAVEQFQLDVFGEVLDCLHLARRHARAIDDDAWELERGLLDFLESHWREPDNGIWEVRGERRHFTHSKVMAWVGLDRAVKDAERFGLEAPLDKWRATRDAIHRDVCERGFDAKRGAFTQVYGSPGLDASLLLVPLVGFLPPEDARVRGTVAAVERELVEHGLVRRYLGSREVEGLPEGEGVFLACTFWLADNLGLQGRDAEARAIFDRLLALRNDVGLLSEEYDPWAKRLVGNFPQAFTHVSLVNTARNLAHALSPARHRGGIERVP